MEYVWLHDHVFLLEQFLSSEECRQFVALAESSGFDEAPINGPFGAIRARRSATTIG